MSLESYNNFFNKVAESAGAAAGAGATGGAAGAAAVGAGTGAVEGVVENVQDFSWVGDESKKDGGYHYNEVKEEPKMTVDDVYGKGNHSIVEDQGDYSASSNEKSNVETSTFGKQNDITVTPVSVTENKGIVNNSTIESVEGLNFQQKDKESQDVLDSRKRRDEAEAEDKSNQMRDNIKSVVTNSEPNEDVSDFQLGDMNEDVANEKATLDAAKDRFIKISNEYEAKLKEQDNINKTALEAINKVEAIEDEYNAKEDNLLNNKASPDKIEAVVDEHMSKLIEVANEYGIDTSSLNTNQTCDVSDFITKTLLINQMHLTQRLKNLSKKQKEARKAFEEAKAAYNNAFVGAEAVTEPTAGTTENTPSNAEAAITTAKDAINNSINASEEEKAAANEALDAVKTSVDSVTDAVSKLTESLDNISDKDIDDYMTALKELNKNYEDANDKVSFFKRTDFNKQYVTAIAKANDFDVTLADGSKMSFSEFSTKMATKSPRIAEAMYNAKADRLEQEGHPVLAKIERNKAKMVGNWFGSKFTFADDLVRNQFNQMAETNMRATYAAYNNVLNDPNATPEQKTEARSAIDQANSLMTASAALKASTGFWSGIGDGMGDGTYGTTDTEKLNTYQKTLNTINNYTKIILGLGVTPGANRAYQNMYYLAGDKVNNSLLFNKDFNSDGFALCQEYGNSATAGMIAGAGELSTGVALMFNPSTAGMGANLIGDSVGTFLDGLYGVAGDVNKSEDYTRAVLGYFEEAKDIAEKSINVDAGNEEVVNKIKSAISQIENFKLDAGEVNNFDNWLEGSGSNTADGGKFNQALTYEEWLKLIEADPTMQEYAKKLIVEKRNAKESNADTGVNS